jgi:hypothetical protein
MERDIVSENGIHTSACTRFTNGRYAHADDMFQSTRGLTIMYIG